MKVLLKTLYQIKKEFICSKNYKGIMISVNGNELFANDLMISYFGKEIEVEELKEPIYFTHRCNNKWMWHESWFIEEFINEGEFKIE